MNDPITLSNAHGTITIDPLGATVTSWKPTGFGEVLFISPHATFEEGRAIRGGIPICWPWFAKHPDHPDRPSHGIARTRTWSVGAIGTEGEHEVARFVLVDDADTLTSWPGAFHLELTVRLGKHLHVELIATNTAEHPQVFGGALHTYLRVDALEDTTVHGLDGHDGFDKIGGVSFEQRGPLSFSGPVDSVFRSTPDELLLQHGGGTLTVGIDAPDAVIWNPGATATSITDLRVPDGFVCVEAADVAGRSIAPGGTWRIATTLAVCP